jgi:hypothetical protein
MLLLAFSHRRQREDTIAAKQPALAVTQHLLVIHTLNRLWGLKHAFDSPCLLSQGSI